MNKYEFYLKAFIAAGILGLLGYVVYSDKDTKIAGLLTPILAGVFLKSDSQPVTTNE